MKQIILSKGNNKRITQFFSKIDVSEYIAKGSKKRILNILSEGHGNSRELIPIFLY